MSRLKISLTKPWNWNASTYYRILLPYIAMAKEGLADLFIDPQFRHITLETVAEANAFSDVHVDYQRVDQGFEQLVEAQKTRKSFRRQDGTWGAPPLLVIDTDDDLFNVLPMNPAFRHLGWQVDGKPLKRGQYIGTLDKDGKKVPLLIDGKDDFDIVRNRETVDQFRTNLRLADLVTCSTQRSEAYAKREAPEANTIIIPNCIDFEEFPEVHFAPRYSEIRIFWQGSPTHFEDMGRLKEPMARLTIKYPQIKWIFWGAMYPWMSEIIPADRLKFIPWYEYSDYKLRLSLMDFDINLAPLHPATFNQSRSAIKVYEAAALTKPIMSIAERTGAFEDELTDGENALLFKTPEEFEAQLEKAILDKELRDRIGRNMKQWLVDNRDPRTWARILHARLDDLVERRKALYGEPKELDDLPDQQPNVRPGEDSDRGSGGEATDTGVSG